MHIGHNYALSFAARDHRLRTTAHLLLGSKQVNLAWQLHVKGAVRVFHMYATHFTVPAREGSWADPDISSSGTIRLHLSDGIWYLACTSDGNFAVIKPKARGNREVVVGAVDELRDEYPRNEKYECDCSARFSYADILLGYRRNFPSSRSSLPYASSSCVTAVLIWV
jgi:hypothetical protein